MSSATISSQNADIIYLSQRLFKVTEELGKIEGEARERGYPELSIAKAADCQLIFFKHIQREDVRLKGMQKELGIVYNDLQVCAEESRDLDPPEIKAVFDRQIMNLHEKRGVLNRSLQGFEELVRTHLLLEDVKSSLGKIEIALEEYKREERGIDDVYPLRDEIEMLWLKTSVLFPHGQRSSKDFCRIHFEEKGKIDLKIQELKVRLNCRESVRRQEENVGGKLNVGVLLSILDAQSVSQEGAFCEEAGDSFRRTFSSLPLMFRYEILKQAGLLSREMEENCDHYFHLTDRLAVHKQATDLWGALYHHHRRVMEEYESDLTDLPKEKGRERERLRLALERGISERLDGFTGDLMRARRAFEEALEVFPELKPEGFTRAAGVEEVLREFGQRPVKSFDQLRELILEARKMEPIVNGATERLLGGLLEAAEKSGLDLGANQGVYYWIWWLAHQKDSHAGGENFGKVEAPKDIERLLEAVEKVLPTGEAVLKRISTLNIASLAQLKEEVGEVCAIERFTPVEKEKMFEALLAAAHRGGVALGGSMGVYYWIWFIAHESDPKAGGDQFGKLQAPKDGARLLAAIERALEN